MPTTKAIIFDLGGVLIDWNPQHLYRKIFTDEEQMKEFLTNVATLDWNEEQDMGRSLQEGTDILVKQHPHHEDNIRAYYSRWEEMLGGPIEETVEIFKKLKAAGKYKLYALTNWSAETMSIARQHYDFLNWFDGLVISGQERTRKPFPEFYQILLDRYDVKPDEAVFIDDNARNVAGAQQLGIPAIHFIDADKLAKELRDRGVAL